MVVKSTRRDDLITDLAETFANLQRYKIKLNPLKCTSGVPSGQLLGYLVSKRGIEPNPEKTLAVMRTKQPTCLVDAQKLAGRVAALSRFILRLGDKPTPLYRLLKKSESFEWTEEAQRALEEIQHAMQNAPILAAPLPQETMLLYVAASNRSLHAIKSQALADFLVDWEEAQQPSSPADLKHWTLHFDGSKNLEGAGAGVVLTSPKGDIVKYVLQLRFEPCTNNMAEYEALLHGMRVAKEMGATRLRCLGDSDLVASQTSGTCDTTDANMIAYKRAVDQAGVFLDILSHPSVRAPRELDIAEPPAPDSILVALASDSDDWTEPYLSYLERQVLPMNETEARAIVRRCKSFTIINNELYKCSVSGVFQRCVGADEGRKILRDIHAGDCGHHAGARSIVAKAFRYGFYWPTAHEDAVALVRSCARCQKYASQSHMLGSALKIIPLTWPFAAWGLDMVGKFKTAPGGIITDNGTNFAKWEMADFCEDKGIRLDLASVAHPESNGQAERANQSILHGLKPRLMVPLERAAGCWAEELPSVLWGIRTTPNRSTGFTPFFLVYGGEAVMPTGIAYDSPRVTNYAEEDNERARQDDIDLLDVARDLSIASPISLNTSPIAMMHDLVLGDLQSPLLEEKSPLSAK
nr:uncharacterized protein LOC127303828 [Lolium perenne]